MPDPTCPVCGGTVIRSSSRGRPKVYCSPKCGRWANRHLNPRTCSVDGCNAPHRAKGYCGPHYNQILNPDRHGKESVPCSVCGAQVIKDASRAKARRPVCSQRCRYFVTHGKFPEDRLAIVGPLPWTDPTKAPREWPSREAPQRKRVFIQGTCGWCDTPFTAINAAGGSTSRFCSESCARSFHRAARRRVRGRFAPMPSLRREVYERDGWTCQLCGDLVDPNLPPGDIWSATLDHIIPQSHQIIPDHSAANLRLAHLWCNAVRGDETYYTAADLSA